jgi:hypothetical protein
MEEEANESKEFNEKNKSKSFFDLYPSNSQKSNIFNGTNIYDKINPNTSSSK